HAGNRRCAEERPAPPAGEQGGEEMNAIALALICTSGIDVGWQPVEEGGVEYIVQLDADTLEILKTGEIFVSDIPAQVKDIARLQLSRGARKLPRRVPKPNASRPVAQTALPQKAARDIEPAAAKVAREPGRFTPEEGSQPLNPVPDP